MEDFIQELKEDLREEKIKALWARYGRQVMIGIAVVLGLAAMWVGISKWRESIHESAADRFLAAQTAFTKGDHSQAIDQWRSLAQGNDATYRVLSRLRLVTLDSTDAAHKVKLYKEVADDKDVPASMRDYTRFMAVLLQADTTDQAQIKTLLDDLKSLLPESNTMSPLANEIAALLLKQIGDKAAAKAHLEAILGMPDVAPSVRARAKTLLNQLG